MAVPDFQSMMLPFLRFLSDREDHGYSELADRLAGHYNLSDEDRNNSVPSGRQTRLINRVHWISTYFKKAQLIEAANRGTFRITGRGIELLSTNPERIDMKTLEIYPEYVAFRNQRRARDGNEETSVDVGTELSKTPDEILDDSYNTIRSNLASEVLDKVKSCSPQFFERLVIELLAKMGYGGTLQDAGQAIGRSGDGGIDGIIKEDRLGLDIIYLQAKRWENTVPGKDIREFAGALQWKRAKKGVFITTSDYSKSAREFASNIDTKIILIDGETACRIDDRLQRRRDSCSQLRDKARRYGFLCGGVVMTPDENPFSYVTDPDELSEKEREAYLGFWASRTPGERLTEVYRLNRLKWGDEVFERGMDKSKIEVIDTVTGETVVILNS